MRFGSFVFSISGDRAADGQVIRQTLREIEWAEEAGMDAVWLTEHHFDGAVAYADPVVFGAAVAMRTHRVKIGFAWSSWPCTIRCGWPSRPPSWTSSAAGG